MHPSGARRARLERYRGPPVRFAPNYLDIAIQAGEHQSPVRGLGTRRDRGLPVARSAAHLRQLARAERHAAVRAAGVGRLGVNIHDAAICAPRCGSPGAQCGTSLCVAYRRSRTERHKYGTRLERKGLQRLPMSKTACLWNKSVTTQITMSRNESNSRVRR